MTATVKHVEVKEYAGQRLDNFLLRYLRGIPRSKVYKMLRRGEVRVNGGRKKPNYRLVEGDEVRIPPVRTGEVVSSSFNRSSWKKIEASILFEDSDLIVLNKPAGMAVHGGSGISDGIIELLRKGRPDSMLELAHRLDRDTSGCLAVAKNRKTLLSLHSKFREGSVRKKYEVIVVGYWPKKLRSVRKSLSRYLLGNGERRVRVDSNGDLARTDFEIKEHKAGVASWLTAFPKTGRTHQIRVHCSSSGYPILGDEKYCPKRLTYWPGRLMLHASSIQFPGISSIQDKFEVGPDDKFLSIWEEFSSED